MKHRIYIDTSVIGGCHDDEFAEWSNKLMDEFRAGKKTAVVSDITFIELEEAPEKVKATFSSIPEDQLELLETDEEAEELAEKYITEGAITRKFYEDALHIAVATINRVDVLASWNFRHIVNLDRIRKYNGVNLMNGYPTLEIRSPREILTTKLDTDE